MTEEEWLKPRDFRARLDELHSRGLHRKLRLFAVACCRMVQPWMNDTVLVQALDRGEQYADGQIRDSTLNKWRQAVNRAWQTWRAANRGRNAPNWYTAVLMICSGSSGYLMAPRPLEHPHATVPPEFAATSHDLAESLLHDIFGNPFRPIEFAPEWRTAAAVGGAAAMYESREFDNMPILADALQDAACDSPEILDHCRGPGPHVRGCWVVDHVLGKS